MGDNDRIEALETKLAFQEDVIHKLDDALISQQQQIMDLQRQLKWLGAQMKELEHHLPDQQVPEPPPPHY